MIPELAPRQAKPMDAEVKVPEAAEPKAISVDEPERERAPEPEQTAAPPPSPVAAAPSEDQEARPRGPSTQVESDSPIFTEYAYYRLAMRNKISAAWSPPRASSELVCVVRFQIVRSGAVVGARVENSSGLPFFDHAALRAVLEASPLPPLPADFPDDVVTVHFEFAYAP
jgi:TonB family protein